MLYDNHKHKLLITSILFLLLGIAFMVYPADSMIMLVRIIGIFMVALVVLIFIPSFREREMLGFRFGLLLAITIIVTVFGIILLAMPAVFVQVFWITMGIILILDGIKNLMYLGAIQHKIMNIIFSVISVLCGVLILLHPFGTGLTYTILIGAFYAYSGASGIVLSLVSKFKHKDVMEGFQVMDEIHDEETGAEEEEIKRIESPEAAEIEAAEEDAEPAEEKAAEQE